MSADPSGPGETRGVRVALWIGEAFAGYRFGALVIAFLLGLDAALLAALVWPGDSALLDEIRVWCFGYDPATGAFHPVQTAVVFLEPTGLAAFVAWIWGAPLRAAPARSVARVALAGVALAGLVASGFGQFTPAAASGELPFPAEALRLSHAPPALALVDQDEAPVSLPVLRGRVVVLTAIYAHCTHTCPAIVAQMRGALAELTDAERAQITVLAVTLDPERDTPAALRDLATGQSLDPATWRLLTGPAGEVEAVLDAMDVTRRKDPATGVIEHSNAFSLVDRQGRIAYRLSLGDRQQQWLASALRLLVSEPAPEETASR